MARIALVATLILSGCAAPQHDPLTQAKIDARRHFRQACMDHFDPAPEIRLLYFEHCQRLARKQIP